MPLTPANIDAVIFDYGNTLIEFGPAQIQREQAATAEMLTQMFVHCDAGKLADLRRQQFLRVHQGEYRENTLPGVYREIIETLYDRPAEEAQIQQLIRGRYEHFLSDTPLPSGVTEVLDELAGRYRLAMVSNFPCGRCIRDSLHANGLAKYLDVVVVSADVGYAKPHPRPFETALSELRLQPQDSVYVGDNWLADIQGTKRLGMGAVLTTEYAPYQAVDRQPGDHEPDATITHLGQLPALLL